MYIYNYECTYIKHIVPVGILYSEWMEQWYEVEEYSLDGLILANKRYFLLAWSCSYFACVVFGTD